MLYFIAKNRRDFFCRLFFWTRCSCSAAACWANCTLSKLAYIDTFSWHAFFCGIWASIFLFFSAAFFSSVMLLDNFWPTTLYSCSRAEMCVMLQTGSLTAETAWYTSLQPGSQVFLYNLMELHFLLLAVRCWNVHPVVTERMRPGTQQHMYVFVPHSGHYNPAITGIFWKPCPFSFSHVCARWACLQPEPEWLHNESQPQTGLSWGKTP